MSMCFSNPRLYVISTMSTESTGRKSFFGFFLLFFLKWEPEIKTNPPLNNKRASKINLLTLKTNTALTSYRTVRVTTPPTYRPTETLTERGWIGYRAMRTEALKDNKHEVNSKRIAKVTLWCCMKRVAGTQFIYGLPVLYRERKGKYTRGPIKP